ncbi:SDR family NAD(P)-dependent oxidoreductase [Brachybacterium aquaticum]|uniref:3-oxoacyl-[acyl-carrier protein] reductase n=1 Tax=Brachybacterium aquaticum TaxID=1432564 RepID=A0A841AAQ5_9MICO|nr:SDR family oxidoreductase [Brachybacterium aquaticum]MBB5830382.1 3-oxoacyl-[acyl-carrier protein] reductase [Brachybacterium aquaticum]
MSETALITGASRGIGLETARRLLHHSEEITTLVLFARASADFDAAVEQLRASSPVGRRVIARTVDVGDRDALHAALESVHQEVGTIDHLVNNAGYTNPVPLQQAEIEDFERTMAVNVYAPFLIVKWLLNRGNRFKMIVNIASTAGIKGRSGWLTYSASKAAVINMSQVMREELAIYDTRVVCLSPGRTATVLRRTLAPEEDPSTIMQPEHVARVIETLTSPIGRFIDSENIVVRK